MSTSSVKTLALIRSAHTDDDYLTVALADGRQIRVPLEWFPRLRDATAEQRKDWRLIGGGVGLHWEEIDEDISLEGLLAAG